MLNSFLKLGLRCRLQRTVEKSLRGLRTSTQSAAKIYVDTENSHCYDIIKNINSIRVTPHEFISVQPATVENFDEFGALIWRTKGPDDILKGFRQALTHCEAHKVDLSDARLNNLTDGLMDVVEKLSDQQLWGLLDLLMEFQPTDSIKSHNFHDIWSALDDMCCARLHRWSLDEAIYVADKWYKLNLGKICDFLFEVIDKYHHKPHRLTKDQLVHLFFYMNVCRKKSIEFNYESAVENKITDMTADEMGIVALGFFKSQTKIKVQHICSEMARKIKETDDIHEITLCSILKALRFSGHPYIADQLHDLLQHLVPKLDTLSNLCVLHIALLGTTLQIEHKPTLLKAAQRFASQAHDTNAVRIKDLERILLALSMFDVDLETSPSVYKTILDEFHQERRAAELFKYPRSLPYSLQFLAIKNVYSYELMDRVLSNEFITEIYGKSMRTLPRELFLLDRCIEIECPDYKGSRLTPELIYRSAKWMTNLTPTSDQRKLSAADKVVVGVMETVKEIVGKHYCINHVLPQFPKADIIVCRDRKSGRFVPVRGFENYILGDIMRPVDTGNIDWFCIMPTGWNTTIRNSSRPIGMIQMKMRQLQVIGYKPVPVVWNEFMHLSRPDQLRHVLQKLDG